MKHPALPWNKVLFFIFLSLCDLCLTWYLIHAGQGTIYESNPIADAWLSAYGWLGLAFFKVLCVGLVIVIALLVALKFPRTASRVLTFACVVTAAVNIYSIALISYFSYQEAALAARFHHPTPAAKATVERPTIAPKQPLPPQPASVNPVSRKISRKPAVWLTTWPPQEEMYLSPARPAARFGLETISDTY